MSDNNNNDNSGKISDRGVGCKHTLKSDKKKIKRKENTKYSHVSINKCTIQYSRTEYSNGFLKNIYVQKTT